MPFVEIATGATLHYETWNEEAGGTPVVVLHGMLGTATIDLADTNAFLAEQGYRVIAPTLRGYGESLPKPRDFPTGFYRRDADDVLAFLDALGVARCHIVGYSDGGEISLICAGLQPKRFVSAAVWGAVGFFGEDMRPVAQRLVNGEWITPFELELHHITNAQAFATAWVRAIVRYIDMGGDISISLAPFIACPVLMMLGERDALNPSYYAKRFLTKVRKGDLAMFDAGHPIHTQQPEAFRHVLLEHLKTAGA